jgi:hypothetical protein
MKWWFAGLLVLGLVLGCEREDYSTPKRAARTFYIAVASGDIARARNGLSDPAQAPLLDDVVALVKEILAARDAAQRKFGKDGQSVSGGLPELEEIESANESINGETATVAPPGQDKLEFKLARVNGQWKVDLLRSFGLESATIERAREVVKSAREAVAANVQRLREGKFASARDADAAIQSSVRTPLVLAQLLRRFGGGIHNRSQSN